MKIKNKAKKPLARYKVKNGERVRFEGLVSDLRRSRDVLKGKIKQQASDLKVKNRKLGNEVVRQTKSEEKINILTKAIEWTADGIFIFDTQKPNFPIIYTNKAFQKMTGYLKNEILGRNYLLLYGSNVDPHIIKKIKRTINQGRTFHGEMFNFQKNGKKYWNLLRIAPVRDSEGMVTHYVGIQTNITLMREKEIEISQQRAELLHVSRVGKLAEFVSSLAHEINQPLMAIYSYAQAAQRMLAGKEPKIGEILQYIINDDQRAADVIQRLRSLLKKSAPEMKPIDINSLINETVGLISTDATVRGDLLKIELESSLPFVSVDRVQIQQVLLNLISNSFDALENIQGVREILIRTSRKDAETVIVAVKDSGCGISASNMPKIFTHFFTSKPDGLGMGLSICRSIVEAHGGRLYVENNSDRGVTFYFTIPIGKKDTL